MSATTTRTRGGTSTNGDDWRALAAIKAEYEALLEKERLSDALARGGIAAEEFMRRWKAANARVTQALDMHQVAGVRK